MHKRDDDLRCAEPYVYLAFMDLYRPSYSFFENVRDIQRFALPEDAEKGGLLKILVEGLLRLGYVVSASLAPLERFADVLFTCSQLPSTSWSVVSLASQPSPRS